MSDETVGDQISALDAYCAQISSLNEKLAYLTDVEHERLCEIVRVDSKSPEQVRAYTRELNDLCDQAQWRAEPPKRTKSRRQRLADIFSLLPSIYRDNNEKSLALYKTLQNEIRQLLQEEEDAKKAPAPSRIERLKLALDVMKGSK